MNRHHVNARLVEHLAGLSALFLIAVGLFLYAVQEPGRIKSAQAAQLASDLDEAMSLYAQNCSVCHGLTGEGIGATPALNRPELRTVEADFLSKVIARGLYGTPMPAWSKEDGGVLNDYQIAALVSLIQFGDWQKTQDRVVNLGLAPLVPFTAQPDPDLLQQAGSLQGGEQLIRGIEVYAVQCVACHGADGLGTSLAPALNDSQVRAKELLEIERTILNGVPGTLMSPWKNTLGEDDIDALLQLISRWDEIPSGAIPAPDQPVPVTAESIQLGEDLYAQSCARCHGADGQGTPRAPSLNVKGYLAETNDAALQQIITLGVSGTAMPAWGDRMTEAEIQAIVGFIRSWELTAPEVAIPARGGGPWWSNQNGVGPGGSVKPGAGGRGWKNNGSGLPMVQP